MKIKFRVREGSSTANPRPPPPPPPAATGGQTSATASHGGSTKRSNSVLPDVNLGNSGCHQGLSATNAKRIYGDLAVGDWFIQRCVGKRSSRKRKSRYPRRATPQPSGFGGGSSSGGGIYFRPHDTAGFPVYRKRFSYPGDNGMLVGGSPLASRSVLGKRPCSAAEKADRKEVTSSSGGPSKKHKPNNSSAQPQQPKSSNHSVAAEVAGLPGIVIGLTKEEKEEDFLEMTGAKLPRKPRRRSKAVEKDLLYCFPGMFLSDVSTSKYEVVEEKRSRKSKRRGLKGIVESSDSE